jgi:branched-chain amino acid aminotransferase
MISDIAWDDGRFVRSHEVRLSPAVHSLSYASCAFEGIRSYGGRILKCEDHFDRLRRSADVFGHTVPYSNLELTDACYELLRVNQLADAYIKPLVYYDDADISFKGQGCSSKVVIIVLPFPSVSTAQPYRLATAAWRRPPASCHPYQAKASSTYALSYLSYREKPDACDDILFLSTTETVCESSGSNIFFSQGDTLFTPTTELALAGITRKLIIEELCPQLNISVVERDISYVELEAFDGAFLCGTAMEVKAVSSIDDIHFAGSALVDTLATEYRRFTTAIAHDPKPSA